MGDRLRAAACALGAAALLWVIGSILPMWTRWVVRTHDEVGRPSSFWAAAAAAPDNRRDVDGTAELLVLHAWNVIRVLALTGLAVAMAVAVYLGQRARPVDPPAEPARVLDRLAALKRRGVLLVRGRSRSRSRAYRVTGGPGIERPTTADPLDRLVEVKHRLTHAVRSDGFGRAAEAQSAPDRGGGE
jgi:hypothetical protein